MEDWVKIRNLKKKNPELGTRAIAKLVGVSRNTVKKALKADFYPLLMCHIPGQDIIVNCRDTCFFSYIRYVSLK